MRVGAELCGAALGPFLAGQLLAVGAGRGITSLALALGSAVAALVLLTAHLRVADEDAI